MLEKIHHYQEVESTNNAAREQAIAGAPHGTVIWASHQTAGRGRHGRQWECLSGNCFMSIIVRPEQSLELCSQLSFVSALAVGKAIQPLLTGNRQVQYKWPNDVMIERQKIAGILLESGVTAEQASYIIIGIGLNVENHPDRTETPATSLKALQSQDLPLEVLVQELVKQFENSYDAWCQDGFEPIKTDWEKAAIGFGEEVTIRTMKDTYRGTLQHIEKSGNLSVRLTNGADFSISSGEVFFE